MIRTLFTDPFMQRCFRKLLEYADVYKDFLYFMGYNPCNLGFVAYN